MAGRAEIKCIGPSYTLPDRKSASQRAVNLYMSQIEGLGEDRQYVLESAPGLSALVTMPGLVRGMRNVEGVWYVVAGSALYRVSTDGTYTNVGALITSAGAVAMSHGDFHLVIVDGLNGYTLNLDTGAFALVFDPGWRGSNVVDYLDGYFLFLAPDTEQFYISKVDTSGALTFVGLDFSSADVKPDKLLSLLVFKREVLLFGRTSTEPWINSSDLDFPLTRYNVAPIEIGIIGPRAVCIAADSVIWIGQTDRGRGYVYRMQGHQPVRISTTAVEEGLALSTDLAAAVLWTYHVQGHEFVGMSAPGMGTSWVFDASTQQWHELGEVIAGAWNPMRFDMVTTIAGQQYVAGGAVLYRMGRDVATYGSDEIVFERTWPHLVSESMEPVSYRGLEISCTTGGGRATLEISNDGGSEFGAPLLRYLGSIGRRMERIRWLGLGSSTNRVFRLKFYGCGPFTLHAGVIDA